MGTPPEEVPSAQVSPIYVAKVTARLFCRLTGAFGTKTIYAVPPTTEIAELP